MLTRAERDAVRAEGKRVLERIASWASPFCDGWEDWRPPETWTAPSLPADWRLT